MHTSRTVAYDIELLSVVCRRQRHVIQSPPHLVRLSGEGGDA